ncbi:hypothetical protein QBC44DRAFT_383686 [Cladorrhinum sp. PSN332]|nr:hypothetical protein QBC44DRAFT_383686 [Cladorrhinum sp. PSN332]
MSGQHHEKPPKRHTPHHVVPKHESGYTDEAAEECHDLIDRAEEEAHLHDAGSMYSTEPMSKPSSSSNTKTSEMSSSTKKKSSGLEGTSMSGGSKSESMGSKMEGMGKNMKESMGSMKESMKDTMGMKE